GRFLSLVSFQIIFYTGHSRVITFMFHTERVVVLFPSDLGSSYHAIAVIISIGNSGISPNICIAVHILPTTPIWFYVSFRLGNLFQRTVLIYITASVICGGHISVIIGYLPEFCPVRCINV